MDTLADDLLRAALAAPTAALVMVAEEVECDDDRVPGGDRQERRLGGHHLDDFARLVVGDRNGLICQEVAVLLDGHLYLGERIVGHRAAHAETLDKERLVAEHPHHTAVARIDVAFAERREPAQDERLRPPPAHKRELDALTDHLAVLLVAGEVLKDGDAVVGKQDFGE